jgi:hypothetical protein
LTGCGSNQAVTPATVPSGTAPPVEPVTEFESVLVALGVDAHLTSVLATLASVRPTAEGDPTPPG